MYPRSEDPTCPFPRLQTPPPCKSQIAKLPPNFRDVDQSNPDVQKQMIRYIDDFTAIEYAGTILRSTMARYVLDASVKPTK